MGPPYAVYREVFFDCQCLTVMVKSTIKVTDVTMLISIPIYIPMGLLETCLGAYRSVGNALAFVHDLLCIIKAGVGWFEAGRDCL